MSDMYYIYRLKHCSENENENGYGKWKVGKPTFKMNQHRNKRQSKYVCSFIHSFNHTFYFCYFALFMFGR